MNYGATTVRHMGCKVTLCMVLHRTIGELSSHGNCSTLNGVKGAALFNSVSIPRLKHTSLIVEWNVASDWPTMSWNYGQLPHWQRMYR